MKNLIKITAVSQHHIHVQPGCPETYETENLPFVRKQMQNLADDHELPVTILFEAAFLPKNREDKVTLEPNTK